jgi:hypothetical protein
MDLLKGIPQNLQQAVQNNSPDGFAKASAEMVTLKNRIRERFQELTAGEIKAIIAKLENYEPLSEAEKDYVRTWMVGEAESYVRLENNFKDWTAEFARLTEALKSYEVKEETLAHLLNVHALIGDAMRVAADISYYLEEKARVERFEQAIKQLNKADSELVARLLRAKLESAEM